MVLKTSQDIFVPVENIIVSKAADYYYKYDHIGI